MKHALCFLTILLLSFSASAEEAGIYDTVPDQYAQPSDQGTDQNADQGISFELGGNLHASLQKWGSEDTSSGPASDNESNIGYGAGGLIGAGFRLDPKFKIVAGFHFQLNECVWNYDNSTTGGIQNISDRDKANMDDTGFGLQADMDDIFMTFGFGTSQLTMIQTIDGEQYPFHIFDGDKGKCTFIDMGMGFKTTDPFYFFVGFHFTFYKGKVGEVINSGGDTIDLTFDASEYNRVGFYAGIGY